MIAVLCILVPPLLMVWLHEKLYQNHKNFYNSAITYAFAALGLNWFMMMVLYYVFDIKGDLYTRLNTYNNFACKYILLATVLAASEPYIERHFCTFINGRFEFYLPELRNFPVFRHWKLLASLYATLLFMLNFVRIFDNNFWADEAVTLNKMRGTFASIISWAAEDVHPPLYYCMLKIVYRIFGNQGWAVHLLSLVPCLIILLLSLTVFWKKFGKGVSVILITFVALSYNAVYYNMEIRMYSWAGLFALLSFYELGEILDRKRKRDYLLFALFSLAAAYTHYFAMITVAFFYLVIMIRSFCFKCLSRKAVIAVWVGTFLGYLPWAVRFLKTVQRTSKSYWVTGIPTFKSAVEYLFSSQITKPTEWGVLCITFILFFLYEMNILTIDTNKKKKVCISISFSRIEFSEMAVFVLAGCLAVFGTISFAIIYSNVVRPVFALRYIYAASVIAWMTLAVMVSRMKLRRLWFVILWVFLLMGFVPRYKTLYMNEKRANDNLQTTLKATAEINNDNMILTNNDHMNWGIIGYYYPGIASQRVALDNLPQLSEDICYYLIVSGEQDMTIAFEELDRQEFSHDMIVEAGNIGTHTVYIYRIVKEVESEK